MTTTNTSARINDVKAAFARVKKEGKRIALRGSFQSGTGHVQGMCVSGGYYIVTASRMDFDKGDEGYFDVFEKDSQDHVRLIDSGVGGYPHVGGCQEIGSFMVVGFETSKFVDGRVWLYSLANLKEHGPRKVRKLVENESGKGAGGAGITAYEHDGKTHWLLCSMDDGDLTFYRSNGKALEDDACKFEKAFKARLDKEDESSSTVNLITDKHGNFWLVSFVLRSPKLLQYVDHLGLYRVHVGEERVEKVDDRVLESDGPLIGEEDVHLRWGACINIMDADGFEVYATQRTVLAPFFINRFEAKK